MAAKEPTCDQCGCNASGLSMTAYPELLGPEVFVFCCQWCKGLWLHKVIEAGAAALKLVPHQHMEARRG